MRAFLKNNRQAPRKVRLIARAVIGKTVTVATAELSMMPHKGARTIKKVVESAAANARQVHTDITNEQLLIKNITVDKGTTYVRHMARAFGRATPLKRENSHIRVTLEAKEGFEVTPKASAVKKEAVVVETKKEIKTEKKAVSKKTTVKKEDKVKKKEKKKEDN